MDPVIGPSAAILAVGPHGGKTGQFEPGGGRAKRFVWDLTP